MSAARIALGTTRALIGIGAWIAPDQTTRLFGIDPSRSDRFVGRLFGSRELALPEPYSPPRRRSRRSPP